MAKKKIKDTKPAQVSAKTLNIEIEDEMQKSYIDYAMSVIVGRALPDVRDGLKPVHRRVLYAMMELGLTPNKAHKKSARVVGEVLGKYHPHGDTAVYDTMVRMAQDFSLRYLLVDGHGNFGSIDGDRAAAMRYTEARLTKLAIELLKDIDKETVDFRPNFDDSLLEPTVLPSILPNLLLNGSSGIAVGMATNIPPHNLREILDACVLVIDKPEVELDELMQVVKGPDFPTGGIIMGLAGIRNAYEHGSGRIIVKARTQVEEVRKGRHAIIITELPYYVNKANLIEKMAELATHKKINGISNIRDESDRSGMRIVIELSRDAQLDVVQNQLFKHTAMQTTFGVNTVALVDNEPKRLPLKAMIRHFINHRLDVVTRRCQFELKKAKARLHILEGLLIALKNLDKVIELIRKAKDVDTAREGLMKNFNLSEIQANAILAMQLSRLTGMERQKVEDEAKELRKRIKDLEAILADEKKRLAIIKQELIELKEKYGDERRTEIVPGELDDVDIEALIPEEDVVVTLTSQGYIKRQKVDAFQVQGRGGVGKGSLTTREEDYVTECLVCSTHDYLVFFTENGQMFLEKAYRVPELGRQAKGTSVVNVIPKLQNEVISALIRVKDFEEAGMHFVFATRQGRIKKTELKEYGSRRQGLRAINVVEGDDVVDVRLTDGQQEIVLASRYGMMICFPETEVRAQGRASQGVRGMKLSRGDKVVAMALVDKERTLLFVTTEGKGKRVAPIQLKHQHRGGKGIIAIKMGRTDTLVGMRFFAEDEQFLVITSEGVTIKLEAGTVSKQGRQARGVRVIDLRDDNTVVSLARVITYAE